MLLRTEGSGRDPGATPPLISFYSGDPKRFYSSCNGGHLGGQGLTLRGGYVRVQRLSLKGGYGEQCWSKKIIHIAKSVFAEIPRHQSPDLPTWFVPKGMKHPWLSLHLNSQPEPLSFLYQLQCPFSDIHRIAPFGYG